MSNKICPECGKSFHHLGIARHRAKHRDDRNKQIKIKAGHLLGSAIGIIINTFEAIGRQAYIKKIDNEFYLIAE